MKLIISGGHPSPALAIIDTLQEKYPDVELVFVGRLVAQHTTGQLAGEASAVRERNIPFYSIKTGKWGSGIWQKFFTVWLVLLASWKSLWLLKRLQPDVFLSFGSYVAVPIALACKLLHIPIVTHEQTRVAGISNRVIARWANVVAISYPESKSFFPQQKTILTGLPLRPQLFSDPSDVPAEFANPLFLHSEKPILYISGGSTGSAVLNETVASLLPELLVRWRVIHSCGKATKTHNWEEILLQKRTTFPEKLRALYIVKEQLSVSELAWMYRQKIILIGRAGANTTAEAEAFNIPSIFIPLPLSNYDEQTKNARALEESGLAVIINQDQFNKNSLVQALKELQTQLEPTVPTAAAIETASEKLIAVVFNTCTPRHDS